MQECSNGSTICLASDTACLSNTCIWSEPLKKFIELTSVRCSEVESVFGVTPNSLTPERAMFYSSKCIIPGSVNDPNKPAQTPAQAAQEKNKKAVSIAVLLVILIIAGWLIYYL